MENSFFDSTKQARKIFKNKFINKNINEKEFYIIDNLDSKHPGVWALFGKPNNDTTEKWFCLQVGQTQHIEKEIKTNIYFIKNQNKQKVYVNQFKECLFEYSEATSIREVLYKHINENYTDLVFVCVSHNDNADDRKNIESYFAKTTHALFWRNGKPYSQGEKIDLNIVFNNKSTKQNTLIDKDVQKNIDKFITKFINQ